jgi:hypothetical protein
MSKSNKETNNINKQTNVEIASKVLCKNINFKTAEQITNTDEKALEETHHALLKQHFVTVSIAAS